MFEKAVLKQYAIGMEKFAAREADAHIAFGISANFTYPIGVFLTSILENNQDLKLAVHIFSDGELSESEKQRFETLTARYAVGIYIYVIDNVFFRGLDTKEFTIAAYYRFIIPSQLEGLAKKFIYLDADMICVGALKALLALDFEDKTACVVEDFKLEGGRPVLSDKKGEAYFNSGMMYIDIKKWIKEQISEKSLQLLRAVNKDASLKKKYGFEFRCFDQDALNIILQGKAKFIPPKYNFLCNISLRRNKNLQEVPSDTIIIHYHGFNKPWHEWCFHTLARYFRHYWQLSPWHDVSLDKNPSKYRQMRLYAQYFFRKGRYDKSLYWLCCSFKKKYSK